MATQMTQHQWQTLCNAVADQMKIHTRPYVTPLIQDVEGKEPENGTGTYVEHDGFSLLTCNHVAVLEPFLHQLNNHDGLMPLPVTWHGDPAPIDAALAAIPVAHWNSVLHFSRPLGMDRFASAHQPVDNEVLFFRGVSGENVVVGAKHSRVIPTGYCSQELHGSGDDRIFEILWKPANTTVTSGTEDEVAKLFKYLDPHGFSGSLVWNTRFVEKGCDLSNWSPCDAEVTGLLRRWDEKTETLLAWRVEHLLAWIATQ
jgi:hypothetical protein